MHTLFMHVHLFSFYTLIRPLSDDPEFAHPGIGVYSKDQLFREYHTPYEKPEFSYLIVLSRYFSCFSLYLLISWFCALN